ncbi:MAG: hypothetical protein ABI602_01535 [Candidatus Saccharibacteria bacterium]
MNNESAEADLPCKDKLAFDTRKQAETTATVVEYRYGSTVHAYLCRHCQLWHLSSNVV